MKKRKGSIVDRVWSVLDVALEPDTWLTVDTVCLILGRNARTSKLLTTQMQRAVDLLVRQGRIQKDVYGKVARAVVKRPKPGEALAEARPCSSEYASLPVVFGVLDVLAEAGGWVDYNALGSRITLRNPGETMTSEDVSKAVTALLNLNRIEQGGGLLRLTNTVKQCADIARLERLLKEEREAGAALLKKHDMLRTVIRLLVDS